MRSSFEKAECFWCGKTDAPLSPSKFCSKECHQKWRDFVNKAFKGTNGNGSIPVLPSGTDNSVPDDD